MTTFAERLKNAMEQASMSQSALSEQAGASKAAISQYLSGKNTPGPDRIKALADATGVSFDYLMGYGAAPVAEPPIKKISVKEAAFPSGTLFPEPALAGITTSTPPSSVIMWVLISSIPSSALRPESGTPMDNTRDELLDLIRNATNIDMICFFAIIYVVAPDSPPYTPIATRGELKKAIKQLRSAQHSPDCPAEMSEGFETAIQYIRREWLHQ